MIIRKVVVNALTNAGAISARRTELFKDYLKDEFSNFEVPAFGVATLAHNGKGKAVILTSNQISVSWNRVDPNQQETFDPDDTQRLLVKMFDAPFLSLDPGCKLNIHIEAVEQKEFNVGENSIQVTNMGDFTGIRGVGIRAIIGDDTYHGDYRVEPLVNDMSFAFFELQIETINEVSILDFKEHYAELLSRFNTKYKDSISWYLSQG